MQEPSLKGLSAPAEPADTTEYTPKQKIAVALGVAAIGGYIGYTLVQSYRGEPPQAIWTHTTEANASVSTAIPHVAFVNLHEELRPSAREGLQGWLDLDSEVQLTFPTVMFVEEDETSTLADIASNVRRATLFAHSELRETHEHEKRFSSPAQQLRQLCTVVYRTVIEVEGQPLEDWDVDASALRKWHSKPFTQRHCLGFTVDGRSVTLLMQDVEGVFHTSKLVSDVAKLSKSAVQHNGAALLRECEAPSTATFGRWWPPAVTYAAASASMMSFDSSTKNDDKADVLKSFECSGHPSSLWRGPFSLFSLLGTVLRYNRPDAAVYPTLLSRTAHMPTPPNAPHGLWSAVKGWPLRLSFFLLPHKRKNERRYCERQSALSAAFLILVKAASSNALPSIEVMKEVQNYTAQWVRHFATIAPTHEAALVELQRGDAGQWGLRVDLTFAQCTVVEAAWLLTRVVGLLTAVGVSLLNAQLVVVPKMQSSASLLYPTAESEDVLHYWKPCKLSPSKSLTGGVEAKLGSAPSAHQHPGWVPVALCAEERIGFVVAQHDFTSL
ncbi:hypothetical protein ABL78_4053 [Leptomonas seymouri]|uniref:Uncharacterized protein n=1 Tax=Leptomonas seymouri TaxID=5684 RepID=A0A0N1I3Z6_LEPSE|nr:hypothetical protein ABL78_4053 [Leptomonas seymouri]|eukprot:KPI86863.1 hypothetical protein ABL78_4053 [Leptomonas seymouri]